MAVSTEGPAGLTGYSPKTRLKRLQHNCQVAIGLMSSKHTGSIIPQACFNGHCCDVGQAKMSWLIRRPYLFEA